MCVVWQFIMTVSRPRNNQRHSISQTFADGQGKYAEADLLYARSLAIREKVLGPEHPEFATSLSNRAELLKSQVRMFLSTMFDSVAASLRNFFFLPHEVIHTQMDAFFFTRHP